MKYTNSNNNQFTIKTCFPIPDNKMPEELRKFFKKIFIDLYVRSMFPLLFNYIEIYDEIKKRYEEARRLYTSDWEIIVEDKNGKKVRYTPNSEEIEILQNRNESTNEPENNQSKRNKIDSKWFGLNLILLISLILLNF